MKRLIIATATAAGLVLGGAGLAMAANPDQTYTSGVGGNGSAKIDNGQSYGGVGGNGSAKVGADQTSGVGGNGSAKVKNGQSYGGVGGNGSATKKQQ